MLLVSNDIPYYMTFEAPPTPETTNGPRENYITSALTMYKLVFSRTKGKEHARRWSGNHSCSQIHSDRHETAAVH